jgi:hypothetical protein
MVPLISYWYFWPSAIVIWVLVGWAVFAVFEARALSHDARKDQISLSMFCYTIGSKFPLSIALLGVLIGLFFGILFTHLLWHWCPPGSISAG